MDEIFINEQMLDKLEIEKCKQEKMGGLTSF